MYHVYVLQSQSTGKHYIGSTGNLVKRLAEHNNNQVRSTKNRGPWQIVYSEECPDRAAALQREHCVKRLKGGNGFKKLLKSTSPSSSLV